MSSQLLIVQELLHLYLIRHQEHSPHLVVLQNPQQYSVNLRVYLLLMVLPKKALLQHLTLVLVLYLHLLVLVLVVLLSSNPTQNYSSSTVVQLRRTLRTMLVVVHCLHLLVTQKSMQQLMTRELYTPTILLPLLDQSVKIMDSFVKMQRILIIVMFFMIIRMNLLAPMLMK